jgi:hypothetical protein
VKHAQVEGGVKDIEGMGLEREIKRERDRGGGRGRQIFQEGSGLGEGVGGGGCSARKDDNVLTHCRRYRRHFLLPLTTRCKSSSAQRPCASMGEESASFTRYSFCFFV